MKKALLIASASLFTATFSYAGGEGWMQDFEAAKKQAAEEKKDLLLDFTGSDWCPPCQDLSERILSQDSFKTAAGKNYILVELDFPRDQSKVTEEIKTQNKELAEAYGIQGYPTIILTDAQGRPFGQTGHRPGTPEDYLAHLAELQEVKTTRDEAFTKAEKAEGVEKAKALYAGLQGISDEHMSFYSEVVETIKTNDPKDETGLIADQAKKKAKAEADAALQEKMDDLNEKLAAAIESGDSKKALGLIDGLIAEEKLEGEKKQQVLAIKINVFLEDGDFDSIAKVADEVIAIDPDSNFSGLVKDFKDGQLGELRKAHEAAKAEKPADKPSEKPAEKEEE